jgi:DNA-binding transcriptional LysR family regulator
MREPMVLVCESGHPLADRARVHLTDLAGHDFIDFPRDREYDSASTPASPPPASIR